MRASETNNKFPDHTFDNGVSHKQLASLISCLILVYLGDEDRQLVFRAALNAEPQTTDLLPCDLDHALLEITPKFRREYSRRQARVAISGWGGWVLRRTFSGTHFVVSP